MGRGWFCLISFEYAGPSQKPEWDCQVGLGAWREGGTVTGVYVGPLELSDYTPSEGAASMEVKGTD